MRYPFHEGEVEIPDDYLVAPINLLRVPQDDGDLEISVARLDAPSLDLAAAVEQHTAKIRRELPRFMLHQQRSVTLDGRPTIEREIEYATQAGASRQWLAASLHRGQLIIVAVAATPAQHEAVTMVFRHVTQTLTWSEEA